MPKWGWGELSHAESGYVSQEMVGVMRALVKELVMTLNVLRFLQMFVKEGRDGIGDFPVFLIRLMHHQLYDILQF